VLKQANLVFCTAQHCQQFKNHQPQELVPGKPKATAADGVETICLKKPLP
jgi:hypothetical protein